AAADQESAGRRDNGHGTGAGVIRLMVVDDHPIVRQGLVGVLEDEPDLEVVAAYGSARDAIAHVHRLQPDVVLLDLEMPELVADGLPTKQVARSLGITERTVKFHVNSIFHKLGADNRAQAVALAAQRGLL